MLKGQDHVSLQNFLPIPLSQKVYACITAVYLQTFNFFKNQIN